MQDYTLRISFRRTWVLYRKVNCVFAGTVRPWRLEWAWGGTLPLEIKTMRSPVCPAVATLTAPTQNDTTRSLVMLTAEAKPSSRQMGHGNSAAAIRYNALHFRFWVLISIWARRNNWVVCHSQPLSYLTCWSLKFFYIWSVVTFVWWEKLTKLGLHADKIKFKKKNRVKNTKEAHTCHYLCNFTFACFSKIY